MAFCLLLIHCIHTTFIRRIAFAFARLLLRLFKHIQALQLRRTHLSSEYTFLNLVNTLELYGFDARIGLQNNPTTSTHPSLLKTKNHAHLHPQNTQLLQPPIHTKPRPSFPPHQNPPLLHPAAPPSSPHPPPTHLALPARTHNPQAHNTHPARPSHSTLPPHIVGGGPTEGHHALLRDAAPVFLQRRPAHAALQYVQWLHTRAVVVKPRVVFEAIGDGEQELEWERRRGVVEELRERSRMARRGKRVCVYGEGRAERERRWRALREEERELRRAEEPRGLTGVVFRGRLGGMEALRALVSRCGEEDARGAGEVDGWDWDWIRGYVEGPARPSVRVDSLAEEFDRLVLDGETRGMVESWKGDGGEEDEGDESDDCGTVIYSPGGSEEDYD
ncbi:hypothetical protein IQ07DRAFT_605423 [Pyrenochaeta sp. DS3sAY3a]|nr:hypothetical protein IQ07DRAFT_605423 [Pyrenochaeta sp. DS3sAY3a]